MAITSRESLRGEGGALRTHHSAVALNRKTLHSNEAVPCTLTAFESSVISAKVDGLQVRNLSGNVTEQVMACRWGRQCG